MCLDEWETGKNCVALVPTWSFLRCWCYSCRTWWASPGLPANCLAGGCSTVLLRVDAQMCHLLSGLKKLSCGLLESCHSVQYTVRLPFNTVDLFLYWTVPRATAAHVWYAGGKGGGKRQRELFFYFRLLMENHDLFLPSPRPFVKLLEVDETSDPSGLVILLVAVINIWCFRERSIPPPPSSQTCINIPGQSHCAKCGTGTTFFTSWSMWWLFLFETA